MCAPVHALILVGIHLEEFSLPEVGGLGDIAQAADNGCHLLLSRLQSSRRLCSAEPERLHLLLKGSHLLCVGKVPASARELPHVCPCSVSARDLMNAWTPT